MIYVILDRADITEEMLQASEYTKATDIRMSIAKDKGLLKFSDPSAFPLKLHLMNVKTYNDSAILPILAGSEWTSQPQE